MKTNLLDPLSREIENDLRLHIHSHLTIARRNLWKINVRDLNKFVTIRPIRFFDTTIDIKGKKEIKKNTKTNMKQPITNIKQT